MEDRLPACLGQQASSLLNREAWDVHGRTDRYFENHPHLTGEVAKTPVNVGVALVGIDSFNIDSADDGTCPVHSALLGTRIPIVEHLCHLEKIPDPGARFFAAPVKVKGMGTFPARAFAKLKSFKERRFETAVLSIRRLQTAVP